MMTALSSFRLVRPRSLQDALDRLFDDPDLVPLAGCTDVYVGLHFGTEPRTAWLDITGLRELRGIQERAGLVRFGALTTHSDVVNSAIVQRSLPMLAAACREIGGVQIQNRGTLGGNIANASPAGDTLPVFAAADAVLVLTGRDGERRVPFTAFYTGYRSSVLQRHELITAIEVAPPEGRQWFRKVGTRAAQAISKVVLAGVRGPETRLAIGSVAPTVLRLHRTEAAIAADAAPDDVAGVMDTEIAPIDDIRSTARYRREVSLNLLRRFLAETA
jgi:xanthine dehydrogenase small subunit